MILHLAADEKFIDSAIYQFETTFPDQNVYYILTNNVKKIKYVKLDNKNIRLAKETEDVLAEIVRKCENYKLIVLHGLDAFKSKVVLKSIPAVKFLWIIWGNEVYNNHRLFKYNILGNKTRKQYGQKLIIERIKDIFRLLYFKFIFNEKPPEKLILKALKRINYMGSGIKEEYDLFFKYGIINAKYFKYLYYPIEYILQDQIDKKVSSNNIMIGHSASITSNHLEIFEMIQNVDLGDSKIYLPLSYGPKEFANKIKQSAINIFGEGVITLEDFLPLNQYNKIVQSCSIFLFNHYRQKAFGNIIVALWFGARVYLNSQNIILQSLINKGVTLFNIDNFIKDFKAKKLGLSTEIIKKNREILLQEYGENKLLNSLKAQLTEILNES